MTEPQQSDNRKLLPVGIQDFRTIRQDNYYYVDKTQLIHQLVNRGRHYFLSRPRRFGKSLLLDTIRLLFEGEEELFKGLAIHNNWDWSVKYPVVRISFGGKHNESGDLERRALNQLVWIKERYQIEFSPVSQTGPDQLEDLLRRLHHKTGQQVVVLVDEYDKPILDVLDDPKMAKANRDYLSGFYGIIKDSANHVRFVFVTGVSMFSKVNLFSGLNNLKNISLDPRYATICGYTEGDLERVFASELSGFDREEIRRWYNGYNWLGDERVYNPYDVLELFDTGEFDSHWFQTGTPTFLYRVMTRDRVSSVKLENGGINKKRLTKFDIEDIDFRSLMFQSGYLTIGEVQRKGDETLYTLEYPNLEVRKDFNTGFLAYIGLDDGKALTDGQALLEHLASNDFKKFNALLRTIYDAIPNQWYHKNNPMTEYEGFYLSVLYTHLKAVGADVQGEVSSSRGRADLVLKHSGQVFVMEAKVVEDESKENVENTLDDAMKQISGRSYGDQYRGRYTAIHEIAIVFGKKARNLVGFKVEAG